MHDRKKRDEKKTQGPVYQGYALQVGVLLTLAVDHTHTHRQTGKHRGGGAQGCGE